MFNYQHRNNKYYSQNGVRGDVKQRSGKSTYKAGRIDANPASRGIQVATDPVKEEQQRLGDSTSWSQVNPKLAG